MVWSSGKSIEAVTLEARADLARARRDQGLETGETHPKSLHEGAGFPGLPAADEAFGLVAGRI
jgi:hypothetical protein